MNKSIHILKLLLMMTLMSAMLTSCITILDQGPNGRDGKVYFGIDYDYNPPYSYWDNNDNVPLNPYFGEMYRTESGTYDFEYFINPYEYWYGTYTLHRNRGELGGSNGTRGADGADTFLRLICNEDGFYYDGWEDCACYKSAELDGSVIITADDETLGKFQIKMKKAKVTERPPMAAPKLTQKSH